MGGAIDPRAQVLGRGDPHELAELVDQMRLVDVTVPGGQVGPVGVGPAVEVADYPLQPLHPSEALGVRPTWAVNLRRSVLGKIFSTELRGCSPP
ncbi:MAG TPA: hypothetical protein VEF71_22490 [Streptosporangiaceae bacterium]|nr:hypothetical protein [Streptosporangiaceae bacterium]